MKFTKMQACGNDYVYINRFEEQVDDPVSLAVKLSDRHYGIGSDGLILIEPSPCADAFMHMFNLDGSEGRMCGNGVRCVAKYIYDNGIIPEDRRYAVIETRAGIRTVELEITDGCVSAVTVDMGQALETGRGCMTVSDDLKLSYIGMDIGNPHAVVFMDENAAMAAEYGRQSPAAGSEGDVGTAYDTMELKTAGMTFQRSHEFPGGVNVEFIEVLGRSEIKMRVWERGSGETLACGSGAAAAAAAGIITGRLDSPVLVHLAGGDITIDYDKTTGSCFMTGPAVKVFEGYIEI